MQNQNPAAQQLATIDAVIAMGEINATDSETIIDRLLTESDTIGHRPHFDTDDVVTPRPGFAQQNVGVPHVVIRQKAREPNRNGWGTPEYGKVADLLVAYVAPTGDIITKWLESWTFEDWDDDRHGGAYDKRAEAARKGLEDLKVNAEVLRKAIADDTAAKASAAAAQGSADEPKVVASATAGDAEAIAKPADDANAVDTVNPVAGASEEPNPTTAL